MYWPVKPFREMTDEDLLSHFSGVPVNLKSSRRSCIGVTGSFSSGRCKWFCLDCDNQTAVDTAKDKIVPILEKYKIDYIWEHSGTGDNKGHLWFMCDLPFNTLRDFVFNIFLESGVSRTDKNCDFELFPIVKKSNVIRLPGGYHLRNKKVNPITYQNKTSNDILFILDTFINAKQLIEEDVRKISFTNSVKSIKPKVFDSLNPFKKRQFYYHSRNLKLPFDNLPPIIKKVSSNCQAINEILTECKDDNLLNETSGAGHIAGLFLMGLAVYNDFREKPGKIVTDTGRKWAKWFFDTYRDRDYHSHNWDKTFEKAKEDGPERIFPSCQAWDNAFDKCQGCPFKGKTGFTTPKQLWSGESVKKELVKELRLVSVDDIRRVTLKNFKIKVHGLIDNEVSRDIILASPQGSGKSWSVDELAVELSKKGKKVLIAVPTADLALEHRKRLMQMGEKPFVIMSHKNLFENFDPGFDCPKNEEIQYLSELGMSSGTWKEKYCKQCPLIDKCPYPKQYVKSYEEDHAITIIQHAHFKCQETMYAILKKTYDVLVVDESFIDSIHTRIFPRAMEIELLESLESQISWLSGFINWLKNGKYPPESAANCSPLEEELKLIRDKFITHGIKYRIPEWLRFYNLRTYLDKLAGLSVFYPIPNIPIRIFTDATPPIEYLEAVLDNEEIEVIGDDEIFDYRVNNPANQVIQVLDGSMSKTALRGSQDPDTGEYQYEKLIEILEMVGDLARKEYKDQKILITTYLDSKDKPDDKFTSVAMEWLSSNYPDLDIGTEPPSQICISHMQIGTNKFEDYLVQFLVAGIYKSTQHFYEEVYNYRCIKNYWNRLKQLPEVPNPYFRVGGDNDRIERKEVSVKRILNIGSLTGIFKFPSIIYRRPVSSDDDLIERFAISKTQQAIRLRFKDTRKRIVYIFGNYFLPSFLITDSVLEDDLLNSNIRV